LKILRDRSGQAGIFVVLNLTVLFGVLGLSVDLGWAYFRRQAAQTAADAAAMAAVVYATQQGFTCGVNGVVCAASTPCANPNVSPPTTDFQVGCLYAGSNGYLNGGSKGVSMSGNSTAPPGVTGNTPAYWVQATISEHIFNLFGSFGGMSAFNINATATAGIATTPPGACVYVLDPSVSNAFSIGGSAEVTATCGIFVHSSSPNAFSINGNPTVNAAQILVNGGGTSGKSTPEPTFHSPTPIDDPLSILPMPPVPSTCDHTSFSTSGGGPAIEPGVYCGGISITGSGPVTFNPGLYILNGGGFSANGSGTITGTGVTFFNTGKSPYTASSITFGGSAKLILSAPTTGTYQGMLFLQDRDLSPAYTGDNAISGTSDSVFTGTLYFPSTSVTFKGTSTQSYTAIVAKTVTFVGTSKLKNDPTGIYTGLTGHTASLIN
jgi:hypothetical protein